MDGWDNLDDGDDLADNSDYIFHPFKLNLDKLGSIPTTTAALSKIASRQPDPI
jgi:hypothetical protein